MPASLPHRPPVGIGWRAPHHQALLERAPDLDFIEVHSENFFALHGAGHALLLQARERHDLSLHGVGLSLGSATGIDTWHLERLADLVAATEPRFVSEHACFARGAWNGRMVHAADLLPLPFTTEALDVLGANVQRVQDRLKRPISIENLSAYLQWPDEAMGEAEFLSRLSRRTGCSLLVDINNLYVNALNDQRRDLCTDPEATVRRWLDAINPASVAEMHLAGHHDRGDVVIDDHGSRVVDAVWRLYRHAIGRFGPVPTLIEWDTDVPELGVLLDEARLARGHASSARPLTEAQA